MRAFLLACLLLVPSSALGQLTCVTGSVTCPIGGNAAAGSPCLCMTASGPAQGTAQAGGARSADPFPHFCCTPAGRFGPFPNSGFKSGQVCRANTPSGAMSGQVCF